MVRWQRPFFWLLIILAAAACNNNQPSNRDNPPPVPVPTEVQAREDNPASEPAIAAAPKTASEADQPGNNAQTAGDLAPVFTAGRCPFTTPEGAEVTCGTVELPQNRQEPENGQKVVLSVAIFHSPAANPAPDPVIYLAGGPGGYALEIIPFTYEDIIEPFLSDRDYIIFDQRGTGFSRPSLDCPETFERDLELLDDDLTQSEYGGQFLEALSACHERLTASGIDLSAFNSAENAADVADLRLALGYESWNLLGVSYGTRLAQTIMRDHPEGIKSVILDSPYPLEADLQEAIPAHMSRAFDVFFAGCAADAACQDAYPELETTFYNLVDELNQEPIEFSIIYFLNGREYDVSFNGDELIDILFQSLYSNEIFPLVPRVIYETRDGLYDTLSLLYATFLVNGEFFSTGMYRSVQCHEELSFSDLDAVAAASAANPRLSDYFANWDLAYEACDIWQNGAAPPIENQPVVSDLPTLIFTGEYDPITPPAWGDQIADNLTNEIIIEFPSIGHGAVSSHPCPRAIAAAFLRDPLSAGRPGCLSTIAPPVFDVPRAAGGGNSDAAVRLVSFETELPTGKTLTGLSPEGWEETGPGIYLRGRDIVDQAGIIFQSLPNDRITVEEYVDFFIRQLAAQPPDDPLMYEDGRNRNWEIYETEIQTAPLLIAVAIDGENILGVVFVVNAGELESLRPVIFEPALNALIVK